MKHKNDARSFMRSFTTDYVRLAKATWPQRAAALAVHHPHVTLAEIASLPLISMVTIGDLLKAVSPRSGG